MFFVINKKLIMKKWRRKCLIVLCFFLKQSTIPPIELCRKKGMTKFRVCNLEWFGADDLWKIFKSATNKKVIQKLVDILTDLHLRLAPNLNKEKIKKQLNL